jgi:hypothetical protein
LRPLRLRDGGRDQERSLHLLPLHGLQGKNSRSRTPGKRFWRRTSPAY